VAPWVRQGELERAIALCESKLAAMPRTEYQKALGRSWARQTQEAAGWLASFYRAAKKDLPVRALYCEMNRFEINTAEWSIDAFAYDFFGNPDDLGWLVGWKEASSHHNRLVLRGMADLQEIFSRDYSDAPPPKVRAASESAILLLTLRMQQLIDAAAKQARQAVRLPQDIPVLAAAHDSDLVSSSYGNIKPTVTRHEPPRPVAGPPPKPGAPHGLYEIDGGRDEFHNSLPWDVLDYARVGDFMKYDDQLGRPKPLAGKWKIPRLTLRRRKWRCDLIQLYPHWVVNEKARMALRPLLRKTVEFLPLRCSELPGIWLMHPLRHIDLASDAVHKSDVGDNMTAIQRYAFKIEDLRGKHLFGIRQAPGSPARKGGFCYGANYVSEEFKRVVETHGLQGIVFERIFSYRAGSSEKVKASQSR
jgi:hypothetical protein